MDQVEKLQCEKCILTEQVLELEEAENDSRLAAQRAQMEVKSLSVQIDSIHRSSISSNELIENYKEQICQLEIKVKKYQVNIHSLQAKIQSFTQLEKERIQSLKLDDEERRNQNDSFMKSLSSSIQPDSISAENLR